MANARIVEFLLSGIFDISGNPVSGGSVHSYAAGTDTDKDLYTDAAKTSPATNPVILNASGRAIVYADGNYKFIVRDADDALLFTVDNFENQLTLVAHDTSHETGGSDLVTPIVHHTRHEPGGADVINWPLESHASNHQEGGADEVVPALHAARHEEGGADEAVPALHHARHEAGGADEIEGLYNLVFKWLETPIQKIGTASFFDWTDVDITANTTPNIGKAAIIIVDLSLSGYATSGYMGATAWLRAKGGTENARMIRMVMHSNPGNLDAANLNAHQSCMFFVPVDGDQIFQVKITSTGTVSPVSQVFYVDLEGYLV